MEKQMEIPLPNNRAECVEHVCASELKKQAAAQKLGKTFKIRIRMVVIQPGIDPRWKVGSCNVCNEIITREAKK